MKASRLNLSSHMDTMDKKVDATVHRLDIVCIKLEQVQNSLSKIENTVSKLHWWALGGLITIITAIVVGALHSN